MAVMDCMHMGKRQGGLSHVGRCRSIFRMRGRDIPMTPPSRCVALGRIDPELVVFSGKALTLGATKRFRFVVHAAVWLHSMVLHGRTADVIKLANSPMMFAILSQRHLRWLGCDVRGTDENCRFPKAVLNGELVAGTRSAGRPLLRRGGVRRRDMRSADIYTAKLERSQVCAPTGSVPTVSRGTERAGVVGTAVATKSQSSSFNPGDFQCRHCNRDCQSRTGLFQTQVMPSRVKLM